MARIRQEWVALIRRMHGAGASVLALADYFGVSEPAITRVLDGDSARCPVCGGARPCVLCRAVLWYGSQLIGHRPADTDQPLRLGIALRGEHRDRYLAIRAEKIRTSQP